MSHIPALPAELTIYSVSELYPQCLAWVNSADGANPALDAYFSLAADAVSEVDAAGVQLLLALQNSLHKQQRSLHLLQPSEALRTACSALGARLIAAPQEEPCA